MSFFAQDLEYDLWKYCIKHKGKWWAKILNVIPFNWFGANKEAKDLYVELRGLDPGTVICIVNNGGPNYQSYIDYAKRLKERLERQMEQTRRAEKTCEHTNSNFERDCTNPKQSGSCLCEMHNSINQNVDRITSTLNAIWTEKEKKLEQKTKEKAKKNLAKIFFRRFRRKVMRRKQ